MEWQIKLQHLKQKPNYITNERKRNTQGNPHNAWIL